VKDFDIWGKNSKTEILPEREKILENRSLDTENEL